MKMRKKLAAVLAAAMIASVMPMTAFADSTNRVSKVVTVEKDAKIKKAVVPTVTISMKDVLTTNHSFYLNLTGAKWAPVDIADVAGDASTSEDLVGALSDMFGASNVRTTTNSKVVEFDVRNQANILVTFEAYREDDKVMAIRHIGPGGITDKDVFTFPLLATVTDGEAWVEVDKYDTEISNSKHLFAVSDASKAKVTVGTVPNFYRSGKIAEITLEELYANSIKQVITAAGASADDERWYTIELRDTDFQFDASTLGSAKIVGKRGYRGASQTLSSSNYKLSTDGTRLGIKIEDTFFTGITAVERGTITLEGVGIIADKDARQGEVQAVIESKKLFDKQLVTIANRGEYKTKLEVPKDWKYEVVAGTEKEVEFTLTEELANALVGTRPVTFTFDQGVKIKSLGGSASTIWGNSASDFNLWGVSPSLRAQINAILTNTSLTDDAKNLQIMTLLLDNGYFGSTNHGNNNAPTFKTDGITITGKDVDGADKDKWVSQMSKVHVSKDATSFTVDKFEMDTTKAGKFTFKVKLLVPAGVEGDITVEATGKGITEDKIVVLKAAAPATVEATKMDIKVGLKEIQTTGKVVIKETDKERFAQGKDIVLRVGDIDSGLKIKSFKATVVEGDLVLNDKNDPFGKWSDKAIGVKRSSTKPSTIEITDIVMSTDRTVPEGKYDLLVGGNSISSVTGRGEFYNVDDFDIDAVKVVKEFINITTKNTEDLSGSANKATVKLVIGSTDYLINDKAAAMDVAPYIKDGRTMVPVRAVATALGINNDQVIWNQETQTATILADKTVQVKLNSKDMIVNGVVVPMTTAAELKADRIFVPVAEIARALGVATGWDEATQTVTFN